MALEWWVGHSRAWWCNARWWSWPWWWCSWWSSWKVSLSQYQQSSFHMVQSKKRPFTFAQFFNCQTHVYVIILCEGFDATEAWFRDTENRCKPATYYSYHSARCSKHSLVVRLNIHLKSRSNIWLQTADCRKCFKKWKLILKRYNKRITHTFEYLQGHRKISKLVLFCKYRCTSYFQCFIWSAKKTLIYSNKSFDFSFILTYLQNIHFPHSLDIKCNRLMVFEELDKDNLQTVNQEAK